MAWARRGWEPRHAGGWNVASSNVVKAPRQGPYFSGGASASLLHLLSGRMDPHEHQDKFTVRHSSRAEYQHSQPPLSRCQDALSQEDRATTARIMCVHAAVDWVLRHMWAEAKQSSWHCSNGKKGLPAVGAGLWRREVARALGQLQSSFPPATAAASVRTVGALPYKVRACSGPEVRALYITRLLLGSFVTQSPCQLASWGRTTIS
jgi:hypothetical protein